MCVRIHHRNKTPSFPWVKIIATVGRHSAIGVGPYEEHALVALIESARRFMPNEEESLIWLCTELRQAIAISHTPETLGVDYEFRFAPWSVQVYWGQFL